jgi:hypothetical protein
MKHQRTAVLALAALIAMPSLAAAETDFATVGKIACVPDSVTNCSEPRKCTTREASANDKAQVLVIDFTAKTISMRRGTEERAVGKVTEDKAEGGVRTIVMSEGEGTRPRTARMTLTKEGKLSIQFGEGGNKAEATCSAS